MFNAEKNDLDAVQALRKFALLNIAAAVFFLVPAALIIAVNVAQESSVRVTFPPQEAKDQLAEIRAFTSIEKLQEYAITKVESERDKNILLAANRRLLDWLMWSLVVVASVAGLVLLINAGVVVHILRKHRISTQR
jgi:hypothetical protein